MRVTDELPALVAHRALHVAVRQEHHIAHGIAFLLDHRPETLAVQPLRGLGADEVTDRREDIEEIRQRIGPDLRYPRAGEDERGLHAVLVEALLAHQAMAAERQTVVRREDDERAVELTALLERRDQAANVAVQRGDDSVVVVQVLADLVLGPRERSEQFISNELLAIVERVQRQVVLWYGDLR